MKINQQQEDVVVIMKSFVAMWRHAESIMDFTSHYLNDIAKHFDNHVGVYVYVS